MEYNTKFLRIREAADRLGVVERTLRRLIAEGKIPVVRPQGLRLVRISEAALDDFMRTKRPARKKVGGTS